MDLESGGDVLVLTSVTRKDSGIYQCRPQDADVDADVRGQMQLAVHCEQDTEEQSPQQGLPHRLSLVLPVLSVLDPAVVVPKDSELMFRGEDLTATCNALSSLKTATVWLKVPGAPRVLDPLY